MRNVNPILTLPVFQTDANVPITAMTYEAACVIAKEKNLGRVNKRPVAQRPAWSVRNDFIARRKGGHGAKTTFNTYATEPTVPVEPFDDN